MREDQVLVEQNAPFSACYLWQLQREYFQQEGITAWQQGEVPHYITCNPFMAKTYAEIVFGFMRDIQRNNPQSLEKIYLLELGAGSGRLAYHLLTHLKKLCDGAAFAVPQFTYIISDLAQSNIDFCRTHDKLKTFEENGQLDYARFDALRDDEINLQYSGVIIKKGSLDAPLFVIANYFFDSIPQDLFYINSKKLYEARTSLYLPAQSTALTAGEKLKQISVDYNTFETIPNACYTENGLSGLLNYYLQNLQDTWLLFPRAVIECLGRIKQLSSHGFILLTADKGMNRLTELDNRREPLIAKHGSFSLSVNYHAIQTYFKQQGCKALFTRHHYHSINVACLLMVNEPGIYKELLHAYNNVVECFGPDDFFRMKKHFEQHINTMTLWQMQSYIRLSGYDARFFKQCLPHLQRLITDAGEEDQHDIHLLVYRVWDMYYAIGEEEDLAFEIGMLLYQMSLYKEALVFFNHSLAGYTALSSVYYNMAACYFKLEDDALAQVHIQKSLALWPGNAMALQLEKELNSILQRTFCSNELEYSVNLV